MTEQQTYYRGGFQIFTIGWLVSIFLYCFLWKSYHTSEYFFPAIFLNDPIPSFLMGDVLKALIIIGGFFILGWSIYYKKEISFDYFDGLFACFTLWCYLSIFWSVNTANALHSANLMLSVFLFYSIFKQLYLHEKKLVSSIIAWTVPILILIVIPSYFITNGELLGQLDNPNASYRNIIYKTQSFIGGKNATAIFFMMVFPISLIFFLRGKWSFISILSFVMLLMMILFLGSRNAYISLVLYLVVNIIINKPNFKRINFGVLIFIGLLVFYFQMVDYENFIELIGNKKIGSRMMLWGQSLQYFSDSPIWGNGIGQWDVEKIAYGIQERRKHIFSDYIRILAEIGILGFLIFYTLIGILVYRSVQILRKNQDIYQQTILVLLFTSLLSYLSLSLINEVFFKLNNAIIFVMLWGVINSMFTLLKNDASIQTSTFSNIGKGLLFVGAVSLLFSLFYMNTNKQTYNEVQLLIEQSADSTQIVQKFEEIDLNWYNKNKNRPIAFQKAIFNKKDEAVFEKNLLQTIQDFPYHQAARTNLFALYMSKNRLKEAFDQLVILTKINPCNPKFNSWFKQISKKADRQQLELPLDLLMKQSIEQCDRKK